MKEESYYIVERPSHGYGYSYYNELLFGKWTSEWNNLRFDGITIRGNDISNNIRDCINHTISPNILEIENAFKINQRTYEVVLNWFKQLINYIIRAINEIPEIENKDQSISIITDNRIIITPYGKEIAQEKGYIRSFINNDIREFDILLPNQYVDFPNISMNYSCQLLDNYWDSMKKGSTKYISNTMCDMLTSSFSNKLSNIISQIKYIHKYHSKY